MKKIVGDGAEAVIYLDRNIIKDRVRKDYRIKEIDERLRKQRTRREAKILQKLSIIGFPAPKLVGSEDEKIEMEHIKGEKLRDILEDSDHKKICIEIGKKLRILHDNGIIHGDLTTSNMIFGKELYLIDFGLSFFSEKVEDKAVDLHLMRQALESKHYKIWKECFESVLKGYNDRVVVKRLEKVEERGRNKLKH